LLLDSFRSVLHDAPDAWLMLAGDGELRAPLEAQARDLGIEKHVTFLGARLDVAELFAAMDVYCLPSHFEGMPLSLFEAMAARRPIVATSVVGIRDLLVDGVNGLLVPPDDAAALARTLLRLRREPELAAALVESGWRQVDRQARLGTMFEAYGHLYESLSRRTGTETL
jgi:glycosyltransferase involved in cell wall biosynthesis